MSLKACRRSSPISWMTRAFACIRARVYLSLRSLLNQHVYMHVCSHVCVYIQVYSAYTRKQTSRSSFRRALVAATACWISVESAWAWAAVRPSSLVLSATTSPTCRHTLHSINASIYERREWLPRRPSRSYSLAGPGACTDTYAFIHAISMHLFLGRCNTRTVNTRTNVRRQQDKADPTSDPPCPHCHACRHM